MLNITINDNTYEIEKDTLNGKSFDWDILDFKDGSFHVLKDNKSYRALLKKIDENKKSMVISINGTDFSISLKDKFDILLESLGMNNLANSKVNTIKAPMPGLVLEVKASVGDTIAKGDAVLILEAMKMENMIKSPGDGIIKAIHCKQGEAVEKNQVMIELE